MEKLKVRKPVSCWAAPPSGAVSCSTSWRGQSLTGRCEGSADHQEGWPASRGSVLETRIFHENVCSLQFSTNPVKAQKYCVKTQKHCAQQLWVLIYVNNTVWFLGELIKLHKRFTSPFCSCNNAFSTLSDSFSYSNIAACAGLSFGL